MAAANTDKWRKKKSNFSTTLSAGIDDDDVTIGLSSISGLPTDTAIELTIDRVDANGVSTPSAVERVIGVISASNITVALRGKDGTSAAAHDSGAVVEDIWEADTWNAAIDSFLAGHTQAGGHATDSIAEKTATAGVTVDGLLIKDGGITLAAAGIFKLGSSFPGITDANANELLKFIQTASAVNEISIKNEATGNNPEVSATGGDTNIGLDMKMKGTGVFRKPIVVMIPVVAPGLDTATGDGKAFFEVPEELAGMNITAVGAFVYTPGTTNTLDVQLRNITQTADILSTVITIDTTEPSSRTAATPAVIDTGEDDLQLGDRLAVDVDAVHTTEAKGLVIWFRAELP